MGLQAHEQLQVDRYAVTRPAGAVSRRCEQLRYNPPPFGGPEGEWLPCAAGASPWVPEIAACGNHMPLEWVPVANARLQLYAALARDVWSDVLAEFPGPSPEHGQ